MKKVILVCLAVLLTGQLATAQAAPTAKAGAGCSKVGTTVTVYPASGGNKGQKFTCDKVKGKLAYGPAIQVYKIKSLLTISQVWEGNKVTLSLLDSLGNDCALDLRKAGSECLGFYIGWRSNFEDSKRKVDYSNAQKTVISELVVGDKGAFQLMYQEQAIATNPTQVVKEFPFSYDY